MQSATASPCTDLWIALWTTQCAWRARSHEPTRRNRRSSKQNYPRYLALPRPGRVAERVGGQVQPWPPAVYELVEVAGQALLEVGILGPGTDGPFDAGEAVHAERHRPHLPPVSLGAVVPALYRPHLACAGVTGDGLAVRPLPF